MARSPLRSADVLAELHADLDRYQRDVLEGWRARGDEALTRRPGPRKWCAVDCLEHVRMANALYMNHLERAVAKAERKGRRAVESYRPGAVGAFMRAGMAPRETAEDGRPRIALKVWTFKSFDPAAQGPPMSPTEALARFSDQLERWRGLLERMEKVDLNVRSNTLLGPFLRLRIGDVVRYLVAHTDRHLVQADRASC